MAKPAKLTRALAEDMAVAALTFIAQDDERLGRFLALSGLESGNLREVAAEPAGHGRGARAVMSTAANRQLSACQQRKGAMRANCARRNRA